jgi:hypothetical protein
MNGAVAEGKDGTRPGWGWSGTASLLLLTLCWSWILPWQATAGAVPFAAPPHLGLHLLGLLAAAAVLREARIPGLLAGALVLVSLVWDAVSHAAAGPPDPFLSPAHAVAALGTGVVLVHYGVTRIRPRADGLSDARQAVGPVPAPEGSPGVATAGSGRAALERGAVLLGLSLLATEYLGRPNLWHGHGFYLAAGALFPVWLVAWSSGSRERAAATAASLAYLVLWALGAASFLLAAPLLGDLPGGTEGGRLLPGLPVALLVPALAIDGVVGGWREGPRGALWRRALRTLVLGPVFLLLLLGVHWYAADFLLRPGLPLPGSAGAAGVGWTAVDAGYWDLAPGRRAFAVGMLGAASAAAVSSGAGILLATWFAGRRGPTAGEKAGRRDRRATT